MTPYLGKLELESLYVCGYSRNPFAFSWNVASDFEEPLRLSLFYQLLISCVLCEVFPCLCSFLSFFFLRNCLSESSVCSLRAPCCCSTHASFCKENIHKYTCGYSIMSEIAVVSPVPLFTAFASSRNKQLLPLSEYCLLPNCHGYLCERARRILLLPVQRRPPRLHANKHSELSHFFPFSCTDAPACSGVERFLDDLPLS